MIRHLAGLAGSAALIVSVPVEAQDHSMANMPGMKMPAPAKKPVPKPTPTKPAPTPTPKPAARATPRPSPTPAPRPAPKPARPAAARPAAAPVKPPSEGNAPADPATEDSAGAAMPGMDHASMDHGAEVESAGKAMDHGLAEESSHSVSDLPMPAMTGTALPAGNAPAPPIPGDHYADRLFSQSEMAQAREQMMRGQGGQTIATVMFNLAEYQAREGRDGYRWDGEAWLGGDINRLVVKTEGEGAFRGGVEAAEVQALFSHAIGPYFNLQAGVRQDFQPKPSRTYATIGFEGLAPYWFEVEGAAFLSGKGDLLGRLGGYYDQRLTQRLVLQPRIELNLAAQDVPESRIGVGLVNAELGLRLRYEFSRQFTPYIGVSYDAKTGRTADYARAAGKDATTTSLVAGVRFWF